MSILSKLFGKKEDSASSVREGAAPASPTTTERPVSLNQYPPLQGDYAKTVFLWAHDRALPVRRKEEEPSYMLYECGIEDTVAYHRGLIQAGYFVESPDDAKLKALKLPELKAILTDLGKPTTGKKDLLIERILDCADHAAISRYCPDLSYVLSDKGRDFLSAHADYVRLHQHREFGIDWQEYDRAHRPGYSFHDTVWGILNRRIAIDKRSFGRNEYYFMYIILAEENRQSDALMALLRVLYIDVSGMDALGLIRSYQSGWQTKDELLDSFDAAVTLAPGIISAIAKYCDVYTKSMTDKLYEWKLPLQLCPQQHFDTMICSIIDGSFSEETALAPIKSTYREFVGSISKKPK